MDSVGTAAAPRAEWAEQEARFAREEAELEARLGAVRESYAERWAAAERTSRRKISERARRGDEARAALERQLADLEAGRESEASARQAHLERQQELIALRGEKSGLGVGQEHGE